VVVSTFECLFFCVLQKFSKFCIRGQRDFSAELFVKVGVRIHDHEYQVCFDVCTP
jgi:hypothetical protein